MKARPNTPAKERLFQFLAALPVSAGGLAGLVAMAMRWPNGKPEWICLIMGTLGCAALVFGFAAGWLR